MKTILCISYERGWNFVERVNNNLPNMGKTLTNTPQEYSFTFSLWKTGGKWLYLPWKTGWIPVFSLRGKQMLWRKAESEINAWLQRSGKALLVTGARQVVMLSNTLC